MTNYARVIPERCNIETKTTVIVQLTVDSFLNLYCWRYFSSLTGVKENENFESGDSGILENENKIYSYLMLYPLLLPLQAEEIPEGKTLWM